MKNKNLEQVLQFIESIDALKDTYRQCLVMSGKRQENTAEHCFSLAMSVICLSSFSNHPIDVSKTLKMALFHDLAEALLGDTFHYNKDQIIVDQMSESEALRQLLTPIKDSPVSQEIFNLWDEFENGQSSEAIFLRGLDRFLPMYHNYKTKGHSWLKHSITKEMAMTKNSHIEKSSTEIWNFTLNMLEESQRKGWLCETPTNPML
jgi:putative hydrolase of HD superfamily